MTQIDNAVKIAMDAHRGQYRKDGITPFITHCIEVFKGLRDWTVEDEPTLCASITHDSLEDLKIRGGLTHQTFAARMKREMGEVATGYAWDMTFLKGENYPSKSDYLKSFSDKPIQTVAIKLSDRYHNVLDYIRNPETRKYGVKYFHKADAFFEIAAVRTPELKDTFGQDFVDRFQNDYAWLAERLKEIGEFNGSMRWS